MNTLQVPQNADFLKSIQTLLGGAGIGGLGHLGGLEGIYASANPNKMPDLFKEMQAGTGKGAASPHPMETVTKKKGQAGGSTTPGSTTAQNKSKPLEFK